jgi:SAM-dependent methyltransferase
MSAGFQTGLQQRLPGFLRRYVLHFEASIERDLRAFAVSLGAADRVLDAGAGEGRFGEFFGGQRYVSLDLGIGDEGWNYRGLDVIGDLHELPFRTSAFDACINIVTLEHVPEPRVVLTELCRTLRAGGRIFLAVPHQWEEHQQPHDFYRYTRYGLEYLLGKAGFTDVHIEPVGGFFRMLSRRLLNSLQFFPGVLWIPAAVFFAPPALALPLLDGLDRHRNFTLGYICTARKP